MLEQAIGTKTNAVCLLISVGSPSPRPLPQAGGEKKGEGVIGNDLSAFALDHRWSLEDTGFPLPACAGTSFAGMTAKKNKNPFFSNLLVRAERGERRFLCV